MHCIWSNTTFRSGDHAAATRPSFATQNGNTEPAAKHVDWDSQVFDYPIPEHEDPDDIKCVMSIVGKQERVYHRIVVDYEDCDDEEGSNCSSSRETRDEGRRVGEKR